MKKDILCGSSCVQYILNYYNCNISNIKKEMKWITELAIQLNQYNNLNIKVLCYESNLYSDYCKNGKINLKFDGFKYLAKMIDDNISINEIKLDEKELLKEIKENDFIIFCVKSSVFNNNMNMAGGHYIILKGMQDNKINVINPIKDQYENLLMTKEKIMDFCKDYGFWRILIRRMNND